MTDKATHIKTVEWIHYTIYLLLVADLLLVSLYVYNCRSVATTYIYSMATIYSLLLLVVVQLLYILIVYIYSMATIYSLLLLVVVQLLYILIVYIYSIVTVYTCKYCWQQVRRCDYEEHIGRSCPDLPMECVFQCGEYIVCKITKQHCQQQCNIAKRIQDDKCVTTCIAVQETDEQ